VKAEIAEEVPVDRWTVYSLADPRRPEKIRYVGQTSKDPKKRIFHHLHDAKQKKETTRHHNWLRVLIADKVKPVQVILEQGTGHGWQEAERKWIAYFREQGHDLTNATSGGEGAPGFRFTDEQKAGLRERNRRVAEERAAGIRPPLPKHHRPHTEEEKQAISARQKGIKKSPESVRKRA
jgi:hypothetical protein